MGGEVAIAVAPNGGRRTKADHPALPLTPAELAVTAARCREAGASMIHVHVRRPDGSHLLDADAYRAVIDATTREVGDDLVVQITSEALGVYGPAEQIAVVKATRPEAASLALRELVPDASAEADFASLLEWMKAERVLPQIILYDPAEAARLADMLTRGLVPSETIPVLCVLGRYSANQRSEPADILPFLPPVTACFRHWSVCAFGPQEAACVTSAALLGGHVRVGFENNLHRPDGSPAEDNADLVLAAARPLQGLGYGIQTAAELREDLSAMFR